MKSTNAIQDDPRIFTGDLPISRQGVVLFSRTGGNVVIKKFKKEYPLFYHAGKVLINKISSVKTVVVRESGLGLLTVLLALGTRATRFRVSVWSAGDTVLSRNMEQNGLSDRYSLRIEGNRVESSGDVAILVQQSFMDQLSIESEIRQLLNRSNSGVLYIVSHKKMGVETLVKKFVAKYPVDMTIVGRGGGGSRVIKLEKKGDLKTVSLGTDNVIIYHARRQKIMLHTAGTLFSPKKVDLGTDKLIKYVLQHEHRLLPFTVLDLACGYGVIGISIAKSYLFASVTMSDVNAKAVELARHNVNQAGLEARVKVVLSDGTSAVKDYDFDLILSNPPLHLERNRLIEVILGARKKLKKNGRMLLVVEDSRVKEILEVFGDRGVYIKVVQKSKDYCILEITK
jgi:16S rRNA (guanine1207-N2)-methyltransferase